VTIHKTQVLTLSEGGTKNRYSISKSKGMDKTESRTNFQANVKMEKGGRHEGLFTDSRTRAIPNQIGEKKKTEGVCSTRPEKQKKKT